MGALRSVSSRQGVEGPDNLRFVWEQEKKNS